MQVQWGVAPGARVQGLIGIAVARVNSGGSVMSTDVRFFGGIDWASETHQVCLVAADGKIIGERAFAHGGAGLAEMCDWLVTTSGEEPPLVAVAIERALDSEAGCEKVMHQFPPRAGRRTV